MSELGLVLGLVGGGAAAAWAALPLLRPRGEALPEEDAEEAGAQRLERKKAVLYENIRDLDSEHAMGKLTDEDYRSTREEMLRDAAAVLKELEVVGRDEVLDRWVENEVRERRRTGGPKAAACPACGARNPLGHRFCDACGGALAARACAGCGAAQRPDAKFCGQCGKGL